MVNFPAICQQPKVAVLLKKLTTVISLIMALVFSYNGFAQTANGKADVVASEFSRNSVIELARKLAEAPYQPADKAPEGLASLDEATYQQIDYLDNVAIWGETPTQFSVQLSAPGFIYNNLVDIAIVENGQAFPITLSETSFSVPNEQINKLLADVGRFAGIKLHYPLQQEAQQDEFIVFQGASYFRLISKDQVYGASARGLAVNVAQPKGEEHPLFKRFWIEHPSTNPPTIVVHALLDSKSVAGAYRFNIYPGSPTKVAVNVVLFPREDVSHAGLAPLTSMFLYGGLDRSEQRDHRPAVHDSEGLLILNGKGERIWRPLNNPHALQISAFLDENPQGFGLIQRPRDISHYQDLEANFQQRPSLWIEPDGDWGKGQVELIEIPSDSEENANIVAFWQPEQGLKKGVPFTYGYTITAADDVPENQDEPRIVRSASDQKTPDDAKQIIIDYRNVTTKEIEQITVDASISAGKILATRIVPNPHVDGARVYLSFDPEEADAAELRVQLTIDQQRVAPTWLYRWTVQDWNNAL